MSQSGMSACGACGSSAYRELDEESLVECVSCRSPLQLEWLDESEWAVK